MSAHPRSLQRVNDLTDLERAVLDFEREHPFWRYAGHKDDAVRKTFDITPTRYAQVLVGAISKPAGLEYDAQTVRRVQRVIRARRRRRVS